MPTALGLGSTLATINKVSGILNTFGSFTAGGSYHDATYVDVPVTGGSGTLATMTVVVSGGVVSNYTLRNPGINYQVGDTLSIDRSAAGGGPISTISFVAGSGYTNNTYTNVALTGYDGTFGTGATFDIVVSGGHVTSCVVHTPGNYYEAFSDHISDQSGILGGGTGFSINVTAISNPTPFSVPVTGVRSTPLTARTFADRNSDHVNILDLGADPTATVDSGWIIQAALNATAGIQMTATDYRKPVYIPFGRYKITQTVVLPNNGGNESWIVYGDGSGSQLLANFNGFVFDRSLGSPAAGGCIIERLAVTNNDTTTGGTSGAIRVGGVVASTFRNLFLTGMVCFEHAGLFKYLQGQEQGGQSNLIHSVSCGSGGMANAIAMIVQGDDVTIDCCDITGFTTGIGIPGNNAINIRGTRFEVNGTAILIGGDGLGNTATVRAVSVKGCSFEQNTTDIHVIRSTTELTLQSLTTTSLGGYTFDDNTVATAVVQACATSAIHVGNTNGLLNPGCKTFMSCNVASWTFPTGGGADSAGSCKLLNCNAIPVWVFNDLPSSPLIGDTFLISNAFTNSGSFGEQVFGATGGGHTSGPTTSWIVWNGSNWTLMSK